MNVPIIIYIVYMCNYIICIAVLGELWAWHTGTKAIM